MKKKVYSKFNNRMSESELSPDAYEQVIEKKVRTVETTSPKTQRKNIKIK